MRLFKRLVIPLLLAMAGLAVVGWLLPVETEAGQPIEEGQTGLSAAGIGAQADVIFGADTQLAGSGSQLPEIAANNNFVALVYEQNNQVFIRAVEASPGEETWGVPQPLDTTNDGNFPKLVFKPSPATNTVHIVWTGANDDGPQRVIRHRQCTLGFPIITCNGINVVAPAPASITATLQLPDVAIDSTGRLHVVWVDRLNDQIKTKRSLSNDGTSWSTETVIEVNGASNTVEPVLATTAGYLHLAFIDRVTGIWRVEYRRLNTTTHSIDNSTFHSSAFFPNFTNGVSGLTIATNNLNVYLAWATKSSTHTLYYGLVGAENFNDGVVADWLDFEDIPSKTVLNPGDPTAKGSQTGATPPVENGLRPSLAITSTDQFAIVWQAQVDPNCNEEPGGPHVSRIYYAAPSDSWNSGGNNGTLSGSSSQYAVDPDIAIVNNGTPHIVFMKAGDPNGDCTGGGLGGYGIFYRGPFTAVVGGVFLPIVVK